MRPMCSVSAMVGGVVLAHRAVGGFDRREGAVRALLAVLAAQQVDPAEEEVLELVVEPVEVDAGPEDLGVAFGERAGRADLAALGGVVHQELGLVDLLLEAPVDPVQMRLFDADLPVPHGVVLGGRLRCGRTDRTDRGFLLSLSGHRAPF